MAAKKQDTGVKFDEKKLSALAGADPAPATTHATSDPWSTVCVAADIENLDKLKVLITGPSGGGKTTMAAKFRCPLIGATEKQGVPAIKEANPRALIKVINNAQDLLEFLQLCRSKELADRCDAVVLDSLTDAQRMLRDFYMARNDPQEQQYWSNTAPATARIVRVLRDLPIHTMVICLDSETEVPGEGLVHRPALSGGKALNNLGQYFNLAGFISYQQREGGNRREVMFDGPDRYRVKGLTGIDAVEAPEPLLWIHKRFGSPLPDDKDGNGKTVQDRITEWEARGHTTVTASAPSTTAVPTTTTKGAAVDPFASNA